jgi:aldehyde:ferredoxin oxidoreductase
MYAYLLEPPMTKSTPKPMLHGLMQYLPQVAIALNDFSVYTDLWSSITGIAMSNSNFLKAGDRIHVLERYMNTREGISRKDDTLPERFLKEGRENDPKQLVVPIDRMLDSYYKVRGYDANGIPTPQTLQKLGIQASA